VHPLFFVIGSFTGVKGTYDITMEMQEPQGRTFRFSGNHLFPDPYAVVDLVFELRNFPFIIEGTYEIRFVWKNEQIGYKLFYVSVLSHS